MVRVIVLETLIHVATPDEMRVRVNSVDMIFIGASNELGQFESGITAHWFGVVPAVILGGVGAIVVTGLWAWMFPQLRKHPCPRSEEHTSELQSRQYLVCRLLLEKKKKRNNEITTLPIP